MALSQQEFEDILADGSKEIRGDIQWKPHESRRGAFNFAATVDSNAGWSLTIEGWWNPQQWKLSYAVVHDRQYRVIGLDLGRISHRNPGGPRIVGTHKHRWNAESGSTVAYAPSDITTTSNDPAGVWRQFCAEVRLRHRGTMSSPGVS